MKLSIPKFESEKIKSGFWAVIIAIILILLWTILFMLLGLPIAVCLIFSCTFIGLIPFIYEILISRQSNLSIIIPLKAYGLSTVRLILEAWTLMFVIHLIASIIIIIWLMDYTFIEDVIKLHCLIILLLILPGVFITGRWIGRYFINYGIITVIFSTFISLTSIFILNYLYYKISQYDIAYIRQIDYIYVELYKDVKITIMIYFIYFLVELPIALIGFWLGKRQKLVAYLKYLISQVDIETRDSILDLAYQEAIK